MSRHKAVKKLKGCKVEEEELLPPIGGTAEELHATLVRNMRDLLAGRITAKQANRITYAVSVQFRLLDILQRLERQKEREKNRTVGDPSAPLGAGRGQMTGGRRKRNGKGGPWVH